MTEYPCPVCSKRACDSSKMLMLNKLSQSNAENADVIIKCKNCKSTLAVKVTNNTLAIKQTTVG